MLRKTLWTLAVDGYPKAITDRSFPLLRWYAGKIGAEFRVITERRFPGWPASFEKLQIFELGRGNDWNLFVDADALVNPDLFDLTEFVPKDTVLHYGADFAANRWTYDRFFRRDGRNIGSGNWFTLASDWCHELWEPPPDLTFADVVARIHPVRCEAQAGLRPEHFVDDFVVGRNIAKYGLKFTTYEALLKRLGRENDIYLWHQCLMNREQKVRDMDIVLKAWGLPVPTETGAAYVPPGIPGWMTDEELQWLCAQAARMRSVVEVGCWKGRSTHALASGCGGTVCAVDHFRGSPSERETTHAEAATADVCAEFLRNMEGFQNLRLFREDSVAAARRFKDRSVDMVFIDGDHSKEGCLADIRAWRPKARRLICGHDRDQEGVPEALGESGLRWRPGPGSIWVAELEVVQ